MIQAIKIKTLKIHKSGNVSITYGEEYHTAYNNTEVFFFKAKMGNKKSIKLRCSGKWKSPVFGIIKDTIT